MQDAIRYRLYECTHAVPGRFTEGDTYYAVVFNREVFTHNDAEEFEKLVEADGESAFLDAHFAVLALYESDASIRHSPLRKKMQVLITERFFYG